MSAEWELRSAVLDALRSNGDIMARVNAVFDERPLAASAPTIELLSSISGDWSSKSFNGREVRLSIVLISAEQESAPDVTTMELIEQVVQNLPTYIPAKEPRYKLINRIYIRARTRHDADNRWTIVSEYRVRMQQL